MSKRKIDVKTIKLAIEQHAAGLESSSVLAQKIGISKTTFNFWLRAYDKYGIEHFYEKAANSTYTKKLMLNAVKEYLSGADSQYAICLKYGMEWSRKTRHKVKDFYEYFFYTQLERENLVLNGFFWCCNKSQYI